MGYKRGVVKLLDRRGGRRILGKLSSRVTGTRTFYDQRWMRVLPDGLVIVDHEEYDYHTDTLANTAKEIQLVEAAARDFWFYNYTPAAGHVIVDVGAGSGIETRVLSDAVGPTGRVYAIEAHPDTYARLAMAVARNDWSNVIPVFAALVHERGRTVFIEDQERDLSNAVSTTANEKYALQVPGTTMDALCEDHGIERIDFLKMNIEGAERLAIEGMTRSIRIVDRACIACHDHRAARGEGEFFATREVVSTFLLDNGFSVSTRADHPHLFAREHVYAERA